MPRYCLSHSFVRHPALLCQEHGHGTAATTISVVVSITIAVGGVVVMVASWGELRRSARLVVCPITTREECVDRMG